MSEESVALLIKKKHLRMNEKMMTLSFLEPYTVHTKTFRPIFFNTCFVHFFEQVNKII